MRIWQKSLIGVGLGVVLGSAVLSIPVTPTLAQAPSRVEVEEPVITQSGRGTGLWPLFAIEER